MGRGASAAVSPPPPTAPTLSLPRLPTLPRSTKRTPKSPLLQDPNGVSIGAASRIGLLHHLRGAPSQDRNAIAVEKDHPTAMLSVFAGHGKHGARLAEIAAGAISRHVRMSLFPRERGRNWKEACSNASFGSLISTESTEFGSAGYHGGGVTVRGGALGACSMEGVVDQAFVEASIAVDGTVWSANSGTTATVCVVRKGVLVVGTCGNCCVMVASRKNGKMTLRLLTEPHETGSKVERDRVRRFGGVVHGVVVSDQEEKWALSVTRSLGNLEMRRAGVCQIPTVRTFELGVRDTYLVLSSQPLWAGDCVTGPERLAAVFARADEGVVELAEGLMNVAFGASGPTHDATILCTKLR